jgi:prepilin-type N-terminal cleavage/methylation domain-containing protein
MEKPALIRTGPPTPLVTKKNGFTLIELVMVIAIIGILSSLAVPKFQDLSGAAKISATKAGLGSLRSALAIRYAASATGGLTASYPASLAASDFAGADIPKNSLVNATNTAIIALTNTTTGTATHATGAFWYVTNSGATNYGKAGAYSDGTTDTSAY